MKNKLLSLITQILAVFGLVSSIAFLSENVSAQAVPAPSGLVLWAKGEGNAQDSSGSGNNGTLFGGAGYGTGKVGQAFNFGGGAASFPSNGVPTGDAPRTFEMWIYTNDDSWNVNYRTFFQQGTNANNQSFGLATRGSSTNRQILIYGYFNDIAPISVNAETVSIGWQHIGVIYNGGGNVRLVINGIDKGLYTFPSGALNTPTANITVGNNNGNISLGYNERIDEVSIYNRALSVGEIQAVYNASANGKFLQTIAAPSGLQAWYAAEGDARDVSGSGSDGTLVNGTTFDLGKVGQTFKFDGVDDYVSTNLDVQPSAMPATTWEAWIYPTRTSGLRQTILTDDDSGYDRAVIIEQGTSNFGIFTGTGVWQPTTIDLNQWQHIAVVYTPTNINFYKNGVEFQYGSAPSGQASNNRLVIGGNLFSGAPSEFFQGNIDEVSIYNRQLTANEISAINRAGVNGKLKQSAFTAQTSVKIAAATVNFPSAQSGTVSEQGLDGATLPPLPMGTPRLFYDVSTNANSTGAAVCFNVAALVTNFANLRVYHLENNVWVNRTASSNAAPNICASNLPSFSPFAIVQLATTSANVSLGGRITTADGQGIRNVRVTLTRLDGTVRAVSTGSFGYYRFENLEAGETVTVSVFAKRYVFTPDSRVMTLNENAANADFTAGGFDAQRTGARSQVKNDY